MKNFAFFTALLAFVPVAAHAQDVVPAATVPTRDGAPETAPAQVLAQPTPGPNAVPPIVAPIYPQPAESDWSDSARLRRRPSARVVPYHGEMIPLGMHVETRRSHGLLAAGAIVFGVSYLSSAFSVAACTGMAISCNAGIGWLLVPVAGPFVASAFPQTGGLRAVFIADGVIQAAGIVLLATAVATARTMLVDDPYTLRTPQPSWAFLPIGPSGSAGVSFSLTGL